MEKKKRLLVKIIIVFMMILFIGCFINLYQKKNNPIETDTEMQGSILIPIATYIPEESELAQTVSEKDELLSDYPYRVKISGMSNIANYLPDDACYVLEPYLSQYIEYYDNNTDNYKADIVPDSFVEDKNWPSFYITVHMKEVDIGIKCVYWVCGNYYDFYSSLSE